MIFSVFFCVTVEASAAAASAFGKAESGMRDVCRIGAVEVLGAAGADRSDGRFRRIVLGSTFSAPIGAIGATPIAESSEIRDVLDFAACT